MPEPSYEGSAYPGIHPELQVDYADYPHLNNFQQNLNPNQGGPVNSISNNKDGAMPDDEDSLHSGLQNVFPQPNENKWMTNLNASVPRDKTIDYEKKTGPSLTKRKGTASQLRWTDQYCVFILLSFTVIQFEQR